MASIRTIAAISAMTGAVILAAVSGVSAQTLRPAQAALTQSSQAFPRCPKSAERYTDVMRQLVAHAARARALADENPLLEPDAAFYEAELAATKPCVPTVATLATR
jgi:hypothetical protein